MNLRSELGFDMLSVAHFNRVVATAPQTPQCARGSEKSRGLLLLGKKDIVALGSIDIAGVWVEATGAQNLKLRH